ncbi:hypothetical protein FGF1_29940 [Flavobacteriaceae bacterium GF1]
MGYPQNLVKNPSFEDFLECPNTLGTFGVQLKSWSTPTQGSTDYFNTCSTVMGAPENFNGIQYPKFGNAYAGLYFFAPADYREYIQVELKRTLQKDKKYHLEFYVSLAEGSDFAVKDFGVVLSHKAIDIKTKKHLSKGSLFKVKGNRFQQFEIGHADFHEDKSIWLRVHTTFIAEGFERYLILGNLRDNKSTKKVRTKRRETKKGAYYYIDMVSLTSETQESRPETELVTDTLYVFKNVHFDFDGFTIDVAAEKELLKVRQQLEYHKDLHLEIHGHTDNRGSEAYNLALSERRAKTVVDYFIKAGIASNRISWKGHGSTKPKTTNDSEQGRAQNRRVAFLLYESH